MNIRNIAIVRVMNTIPKDKTIKPISDVPYLKKEDGTTFEFGIMDVLKRQGKLKEIDYSNPDSIKKTNQANNQILSEYTPYTSAYNSLTLWSLNGLVPDDTNLTFSNKSCAIIDGLQEQIDEKNAKFVSITPTDTAILGAIEPSDNAVFHISSEKYNSLSDEEKEHLNSNWPNLKVFDSTLKESIDTYLQESSRYTSETLSLSPEDRGYVKSDTSEELIQTIDSIAKEKGLPQELHYNIYSGTYKIDALKNEYKNNQKVADFYKRTFFKHLFSKLPISEQSKTNCLVDTESFMDINDLCSEIEKIGIDEYKKVLDEYNGTLETLKANEKLPTPQQIIDSIKAREPLDLNALINETIEAKNRSNITMEALTSDALNQNIGNEDIKRVQAAEEQTKQKNPNFIE